MKRNRSKHVGLGLILILLIPLSIGNNLTSLSYENCEDSEECDYCEDSEECDYCEDSEECDYCEDCIRIVPVGGDYLSSKLKTDPLFNDSFNFANELGFITCVGKWLVYDSKCKGNLLGFIGLRTNANYSASISIVSFESGPLNTILMNFTSIPFNKPILTLFNREGGMKIYDGIILTSWGSYVEDEDPIWDPEDWEYFSYCEQLAKLMNFRFAEFLQIINDWIIKNIIPLSENEFLNEINDRELYYYANELGYTNFLVASKLIIKNGKELMIGILQDTDNQSIVFVESNNNPLLFYNSLLFNFTITTTNQTLMTVYFNQTMGMVFNLSNSTIISHWGYEHHSCDYWRCYYACITDWLAGPWGFVCSFACGLICGVCIATIWSPEPFTKTTCIACGVCIALCVGAPLIVCAAGCALDPCSCGHTCYPGTVKNKHCTDYYAGYYHTLVWTECNDIGMEWVTHYDYCGSRGLICSTSSLTCVSPPGGGGCPNLLVWNGTGFNNEGTMYIHNVIEPYSDVVVSHILDINELSIQENMYVMKLSEISEGHNYSHSTIDQVKLIGINKEGFFVQYPLIYANHSNDGNITQSLILSDDVWTETFKGDEIELLFTVPQQINSNDIIDLIFIIEGHNVKIM